MRILQIAPRISPGTGVAGVAHHLEAEWLRMGHSVERFTLADARAGWIPSHAGGVTGRLAHVAEVVWFSVVGTVFARRRLKRKPVDVSICHNDAMVGDVYVNHGILTASMRARGRYWWRMMRNPLHLFTAARDRRRFGAHGPHRLVVNLATSEEHLLRAEYQSLRARSAVIVNGVDGERFQPADAVTRERFRAELGVGEDHFLIGFVGHEFSRKGLPVLLEALAGLDDHFRLLVVGGSAEMVRQGERTARSHGVRGRVAFVGRVDDPSSLIACTDALCLPSAYEASPLVVLESLACGVPVVSTRTGSTPDVLTPGEDGYLVERDAKGIADALRDIRASSIDFPAKARATAERHSWSAVALRYLEVFDRVLLEQRKPVS